MAKLRASLVFVERELFEDACVYITDAYIEGDQMILTIKGDDVPDAEWVTATVEVQRACKKLTFDPVED